MLRNEGCAKTHSPIVWFYYATVQHNKFVCNLENCYSVTPYSYSVQFLRTVPPYSSSVQFLRTVPPYSSSVQFLRTVTLLLDADSTPPPSHPPLPQPHPPTPSPPPPTSQHLAYLNFR